MDPNIAASEAARIGTTIDRTRGRRIRTPLDTLDDLACDPRDNRN
jgi:hypothetical protein